VRERLRSPEVEGAEMVPAVNVGGGIIAVTGELPDVVET